MARTNRELAFLYDLYIAPTWRDCFDRLFNENIGLPEQGLVLDVNCGTGGHALEMALALASKGQVTAMDNSAEMISLAQAKATVAKAANLNFFVGDSKALAFAPSSFDLVIGDATFMPTGQLSNQVKELARVARPGAKVVLNLTTRGSFDEFYSIFWEALYECKLSEELLGPLEKLINDRPTVSEAEELMQQAGLQAAQSFQKKEEFTYENAEQFFNAPLIENYMLEKWLSILPPGTVARVREELEKIIDTERGGYEFDVSIKATMVTAEKPL